MKRCNAVRATAQGLLITIENETKFSRYKQIQQDNKSPKKTSNLPVEEKLEFNKQQLKLYRELMYGFNAYTDEELSNMTINKKQKIKNKYNATKRAIHVLKAKKVSSAETKLLNTIFPGANIGKNDYDWYLDIPKYLTLRRLNISVKEIVHELISRKLLPFDFFLLG